MKRLLAIAFLLVAAAGMADDSPLVKAAKANGGPKKKMTKKVITNADVKKSTGKLTTIAPSPNQSMTVVPPKGPLAEQDQRFHDRVVAQRRTDTAQARVNDLNKELDRLEQAYYAENDPNYRDKNITERFEQTKKQLDTARKELGEARETLEKLKGNGS